jgi:hypothetical protein
LSPETSPKSGTAKSTNVLYSTAAQLNTWLASQRSNGSMARSRADRLKSVQEEAGE